MKIRTLTVTLGYTRNVGNYNNQRRELSATADVEEGETAEEAYSKLNSWVTENIRAEQFKLTQALKKKQENANDGPGGQRIDKSDTGKSYDAGSTSGSSADHDGERPGDTGEAR